MAPIKAGDKFPTGVKFQYAPIKNADPTSSAGPEEYDASANFAGKKVVLVSVPGAFTPSCQAYHIPPYITNADALVQKGVDLIVIIASNDPFVMSAWGKVNGAWGMVNGVENGEKVKFMSDAAFSQSIGWMAGMGDRNGRWAMIIEKDGTISYAEQEASPKDVQVSAAETVLSKL